MAFGVSQWPYTPDPRLSDFAIIGWGEGQVPPWAWIISTTGATGIYEPYNSGVAVRNTIRTPTLGEFFQDSDLPGNVNVRWTTTGTQAVAPGPPPFTMDMLLKIQVLTVTVWVAQIRALYPTAIAVQGPFVKLAGGTPGGTIPNDMFCTPAPWDIPSP